MLRVAGQRRGDGIELCFQLGVDGHASQVLVRAVSDKSATDTMAAEALPNLIKALDADSASGCGEKTPRFVIDQHQGSCPRRWNTIDAESRNRSRRRKRRRSLPP